MISIKNLTINSWTKQFAFTPVNYVEQIDQSTVKQTRIWLENYWQRISINRSDRSLKTNVLTCDQYKHLWLMETLPHIIMRSYLVNDFDRDLTTFSCDIKNYIEGKTDGREEFSGVFPIVEHAKTLYLKYHDTGLIGQEVLVKESGLTYVDFEFTYLLRILESMELKEGFGYTEVLQALLDSSHFKDGTFVTKANYLKSLIAEDRLNISQVRSKNKRYIEILHKNKTVDTIIDLEDSK
jgi:hypothetical protein